MKHVLRIILCVLVAVLMIPALASAEAESLTWEERLAEARLKYNDETVNIYGLGRGGFRWGKFNVRVYASRNSPYVYFNIMESLRITDEAEMEAVLEAITRSGYYDAGAHGTISYMKAQWIAHNLAYSLANGSDEQKTAVQFFYGEDISSIIKRSVELDINPYETTPERERFLYEIIEEIYSLKGH